MKNNTTGDKRIRAGVPKGWVVADKTGAETAYAVRNDIGIIWPPKCAPITIAIYTTQSQQDATPRDDVLAKATRIVLNEFAEDDPCIKAALAQ
jgi:beta-lactamase class A